MMILENKNAIIYGAGGSLGGAVAKAMAAAGCKMFLTGRSLASVQKTADEITASGGYAEVAQVDGFDELAVNEHVKQVKERAGSVDISFNLVAIDVTQGMPLTEISTYNFLNGISLTMRTRFITAIAAAKAMRGQQSGVILTLTATPAGIGYPLTGNFSPACSAVESLSRSLAAENGIYGIRVVNIRSAGSPDSQFFMDAAAAEPERVSAELKRMRNDTMLKKLPQMMDIANTAVFAASDMAAGITGVTIDVTCGTTTGLNYRME